jgi:glutamate decarboxylase
MVFLSSIVKPSQASEKAHPASNEFVESLVYGSRQAIEDIPRYSLPNESMPPKTAYKLIKDELALDGNPVLNLASFVTTYMEDEANQLIMENLSKNFIDFDEYPQTAEIQNRCVNMIARLFNAPLNSDSEAIGCSTIGSSEAIMLATLAMKRKWQTTRRAKGLSTETPNLVMGANVQVCWEKAARYFEIEERYVDCTEACLCLDPHKAVEMVDENTIGVVAILGSTYTGHYENVQLLNDLLHEKYLSTGLDVNIHVDAASGGFVAPFVKPDLVWDFRLPRVISINTSGHKYGLTYAGVGWNIWRDPQFLPSDLVFKIDYLGSDQASFTLNFSKSAAHVIAQYYILIRLGHAGFVSIMKNLTRISNRLAENLENTGKFIIMSERDGNGLPLVAFRFKDYERHFDEFSLSHRLRERGWIVPAYRMAKNVHYMKMLRVVVREDFTMGLCNRLVQDIMAVLAELEGVDVETSGKKTTFQDKVGRIKSKWHVALSAIKSFGGAKKEQTVSGKVC